MTAPEQRAREITDSKLAGSGWIVQTCRGMNLGTGRRIAVTEFPGTKGTPDYRPLYVDGRAITDIKANPVGHTRFGTRRVCSDLATHMRRGI